MSEAAKIQQEITQDMAAAFFAEHVEEYFFCERCKATIRKSACVERQTKGIITCDMGYNHRQYEIPYECEDCEQGRSIMKEVKKEACIVEGCTETKIKARGMCARHYNIWYNRNARYAGIKFRKDGAPKDVIMPPLKGRSVKHEKKEKPDAPVAENLLVLSTDERSKKMLLLNFEEYPELYGDLKELAADEMRPLDLQVLYLLKRSFPAVE
jgi:hypothetical protein